jgi:hypothetical protein
MPITPSGPIALIQDIDAVFDQGTEDISLLDAAVLAGLPSGEVAMTDFYGLSSEATLTLAFVDSTPTGASMSTSSISITGTPGDSISTQTRTISRASQYYLSNVSVSKSGDTGNNVSATGSLASGSTGFQNGLVTITGTIPNVSTTVTLNVSCTATLKASRGCYSSSAQIYYVGSNGGYWHWRFYFNGGGTGYPYIGGSADGGTSSSALHYNSPTSGGSGTEYYGYYIPAACCSATSIYSGGSVGESATYQSCSGTISRTL